MTARNPSNYLPHLIGPIDFQVGGVDSSVERRGTINFVGLTVVDDPDNDRTTVTATVGSPATTSAAGTMSAADKLKLDGLQKQGTAMAVVALAIDWSTGGVFAKTLSAGANAFTFANQASGMMITVVLTGAASTVSWPAGTKWPGGTVPVQTASGIDVYTFVNVSGTIYGTLAQAYA